MAPKKTVLSRDAILSATTDALPYEDVPCPELGGYVRIRALSAGEREAYEQSFWPVNAKGVAEFKRGNCVRERLVAAAAVDETGARMFSEGDLEALSKKSAAAIARLQDVAERLSGLSKEDMKEIEALFELGQG